jgi:hypothetical protein
MRGGKTCSCLQDSERLNEELGSRAKISACFATEAYKDSALSVVQLTASASRTLRPRISVSKVLRNGCTWGTST